MAILKIYPQNPNTSHISKIVSALEKGEMIVYPTDAVYSVGVSARSLAGVKKLASYKNIPLKKNNFSFVCDSLAQVAQYISNISTPIYRVLKKALPGPYTFILKANKLPKGFESRKTVGVRVVENPITCAIIEALGCPLVSTSVYDEDEIIEYTTDPELIHERLHKDVAFVIDGGIGHNIPTTIVEIEDNDFRIVREGLGDVSWFL